MTFETADLQEKTLQAWPPIREESVPMRVAREPGMPPRRMAEPSATSWEYVVEPGGYEPVVFTAPEVLAHAADKAGDGVSIGWADPETITPDIRARVKRLCEAYHPDAVFEIDGVFKHPMGRLGIEGRGMLGWWGPNPAADAILTRAAKGKIELLLIRRPDGAWALPGAMIFDEETPAAGVTRALREKTSADISFDETHLAYRGIAGDSRDTDDAWMVTSAYHRHLPEDDASLSDLKPGRNTREIEWVSFDDPRVRALHADHARIVSRALKGKGLTDLEIGNKRVIERTQPFPLRNQVFLAGPALKEVDTRVDFKNILDIIGVAYVDPTTAGADWRADTHGPIEAKGIAESGIDLVDVNNLKGAYITLIEAGAAAVGSILRTGQRCGIYFEEMSEEFARERFGDQMWKVVLRTRDLVRARLLKAERNLPVVRVFESAKTYDGLSGREAIEAWLKEQATHLKTHPLPLEGDRSVVLPAKVPLKKSVVVFGSSGKQWHETARRLLSEVNVAYHDTLVEGREFTREDVEREQIEKDESAVALMVVDNEVTPDSRMGGEGAIAEICWQFLHAAQTGQKLIVFIEQTEDRSQRSLRMMAKIHLEQLIQEFPGVAVLADSAEQAIRLAAREAQRLRD